MMQPKWFTQSLDQNSFAPLYRRYPGQIDSQRAYLVIRPTGEPDVVFEIDAEIGSGVTADVYRNRELRFRVSSQLTHEGCMSIIECPKVQSLIERVIAGHSIDPADCERFGVLTENARKASEVLQDMLEHNLWTDRRDGFFAEVWTVGEWMRDCIGDPYGTAESIRLNAETDGVHIDGDIAQYLADRGAA